MSVLVLLSFALFAKAQETTSEIVGSVANGQTAVEGAVITAIHTPSGTKYVTTSRKDGRYNIPNVKVGGPYTIKVSFEGFQDEKVENVFLTLGQAYEGNFALKASTTELTGVTVSASRQNKVFNNNHTGSQEIIVRDQIDKLPTINRSLQDFTKLEPTSNGLSFGGRSSQYNNITVDGANFNNGFGLSPTLGGQVGAQPISLDAIDQIQVNVSPYDVRQGGFSGAGVNTVTKSGTNKFIGDVYTYLKGPGTQGYKVGDVTIPKSDFSFYTRGASLGGPIVKNKLFFYVNYEELKQTAPAYTVLAATSSNPATPGSVSQADAPTLDALAAFLKSKYNYDPGAYQNYSFTKFSRTITAKVDWNIDRKSTLTLKYNYLRSYSEQPQSTSRSGAGFVKGPASQNYTYGLPFSGSKYLINNNFDIVIAELNTRFSKKLSNKLQAGYTRERDPRAPGVPGTTLPMIDILNGTGNTYGTQVLTSFGFETYTYNNTINTDVYQLADIATLYAGSHEITFGTQDYYRKYYDAFAPNYAGGYQFPSLDAFYTAANGGAAVDKYFQEWSNIPGGAFPGYSAGSTELGFFAQDKWRASKNFTLTYGLRYDMTIYKQIYLDNPYFDALTFKNNATYNIGKAPGNAVILSPRVGFNWDVLGDRSLQVRGGLGIFSGPPPFVWLANQPGNNGVIIASGNFTNVPITTNAVTMPPAGVNTAPPDKVQSATSYGSAVTAKDFKYPTVLKYSIAVDKKFADNWVVTLEGQASNDINAVYFSNVNLNESNAFALSGADNRMRYLTSVANSNKYYYGNGVATQANPNLSYAILMSNASKGYSYLYTVRVQKTIHNFFASLAYTGSVAKNIATGGSTASSLWSGRPVGNADPNGVNLAYADYYQPYRIIGYASYAFNWAKYFTTSVGLIYEGAPAGVGSYTYGGDLNGDGNSGNDLMYIPRSQSEINLVPTNATDTRTPTEIWNQFNAFLTQDKYLNSHRGQYVQANAVKFPMFNRVDLNITQDIHMYTGKDDDKIKHTLRITVDVINLGNFISKNWGIYKQQTTSSPLTFAGMDTDGKTPKFTFPTAYTSSYSDNTSILSRWQMQFGIKYMFN